MAEETVHVFQKRMKLLQAHLREQAGIKSAPAEAADDDPEALAAALLLDNPREGRKFQKLAKIAAVLGKAAKQSDCEVSETDFVATFPKLPERTHALEEVLQKRLDFELADFCSTLTYPLYQDGDKASLHDQIIAFGNQLRREFMIDPDGPALGDEGPEQWNR
jgi:hypothetical protein